MVRISVLAGCVLCCRERVVDGAEREAENGGVLSFCEVCE